MTLTYQAGRRIQGTAADRAGSDAVSGGWVELGRTTWASGNSINVSSLPDKRYYMILNYSDSASNYNNIYRFNSDTGSNYAWRRSINGGTDSTSTSTTTIPSNSVQFDDFQFTTSYIANLAGKEKLVINHGTDASAVGAGTAPDRNEIVGKWANTTDPIDEITMTTTSANYNLGEVVVLGWDPADTHTSNFWEELASVELSSAGDEISSGTITAKKYLWLQWHTKRNGAEIENRINFNNDTGSNYSRRSSVNGASDATAGNQSRIEAWSSKTSSSYFYNMFIINNSSNEKLCIAHNSEVTSTGAGNAPARVEFVAKWANTSSQITEIDIINNGSGSFDTGSILKVWGAD